MMRFALAAALGFAAVTIAGITPTTAQEKKKDDKKDEKKTLEGTLVCGKCKLSETDECSNVLIVKMKDGDKEKEIKYYLTDKGKGESYHKCTGEAKATVTGKVVEKGKDKEKKLTVEDAKVEVKK